MKRFYRHIAMLLALMISVSLLSGCTNDATNGSNSKETTAGTLLTTVYDKILYIADANGNIHTTNFYGEALTEQTSMDGSKYMIVDNDDNTLLYFDGSEIKTIANNVGVAVMSADGSAIAYITADEETEICELYRYANGESVLIESGRLCMCAISPDGNTIGYSTCDEEGNYTSYYRNGSGESQEIGKYMGIFAISNDGKYIYYTRYENGHREGFYVQCGADGTTRAKLADNITSQSVYFNNDGTEFIYADKEKSYVTVSGGVVTEIDHNYITPLFSDSTATATTSYQGPTYIYCDVDSFAGTFYSIFYRPALGYLNQKFEQINITQDGYVDQYYICSDSTTAFLSDGIFTYIFDGAAAEPALTKLFDGRWSAIADDGKAIYYTDNNNICYKVDGTAANPEPKQVENCKALSVRNEDRTIILEGSAADAIPEDAHICTVFNDKVIFLHNGIFYCLDNGKALTVNGLEKWLESNPFYITAHGYKFYGSQEQYVEWEETVDHDTIDYIEFFESEEKRIEETEEVKENSRALGLIHVYENTVIVFANEDSRRNFLSGDTNKSGLAGCYFSLDGVNFTPLVENYISQDSAQDGTTDATAGPTTP